jgi:hypothetical protein
MRKLGHGPQAAFKQLKQGYTAAARIRVRVFHLMDDQMIIILSLVPSCFEIEIDVNLKPGVDW